jgi:uncharacterized protein
MSAGAPPARSTASTAASTADPVVARALRAVLACVAPEQVLVFGSRSRGQARPDSDLDLIVVADAGPRQRRLERELRESLSLLALPVDVLLRTPAQLAQAAQAGPASFLGSVAATAVVIYPVDEPPAETEPRQGESAADCRRQRSLE